MTHAPIISFLPTLFILLSVAIILRRQPLRVACLRRIYALLFILIIAFSCLITPSSAICLPCQPSTRRSTSWDVEQHDGLSSRGPYNPKITNPNAGTVWVMNSEVIVTWDVRDIPSDIENPKGTLVLGYLEGESADEHLDLKHKLASGFDIKNGFVKFRCPRVEGGKNYIVVLFGDSGNRSPAFRIVM